MNSILPNCLCSFSASSITFRILFMFVIRTSPVLVEVCFAGSGGLSLHWAWLCFDSVPGC